MIEVWTRRGFTARERLPAEPETLHARRRGSCRPRRRRARARSRNDVAPVGRASGRGRASACRGSSRRSRTPPCGTGRRSGDSILTTSAPRSASSIGQNGPGDEAREVEDADAVETARGAAAARAPPRGARRRRRRPGVATRARRRRVGERPGRRLPRRAEHRIVDGTTRPSARASGSRRNSVARLHRAARHVGGAQDVAPTPPSCAREERGSSSARTNARSVGRAERERAPWQARVGEQVDAIEAGHELHPERLRERADEEPAVGGRVERVGRIDAARIALLARASPGARAA